MAVVALAAPACGGTPDASGPSAALAVEELDAPVAPGSEWPHLDVSAGGVLLSWLEADEAEGVTHLRFARLNGEAWTDPVTLASSDHFFVNWADFPSVTAVGDSALLGHWLLRGEQGGYDYGVRVASSSDGGRSWSEPWTPHEDATPTEHGFVTILPLGDGEAGLFWLDGRDYASTGDGASGEMSIRFRRATVSGPAGPEVLLDSRTCDCCQTDAAMTSRGPLVVYRDRSAGEIRDIAVSRLVDEGWTEPTLVHRDGWEIAACPVNGPAVAARGDEVVVAWFTAARDDPQVLLSRSNDGGVSFGAPVRVDDGNPLGRVDVALAGDGRAVVSWIENADPSAEIRLRTVAASGETGASHRAAVSTQERAGGFPQMVIRPEGDLVLAWTEPGTPTVRVARVDLPGSSGGGAR